MEISETTTGRSSIQGRTCCASGSKCHGSSINLPQLSIGQISDLAVLGISTPILTLFTLQTPKYKKAVALYALPLFTTHHHSVENYNLRASITLSTWESLDNTRDKPSRLYSSNSSSMAAV